LQSSALSPPKGSAASTRRSPRPRRVRRFQTSPRRPCRQRKIAASASDLRVFKSGRDFSAWLRATPRQNTRGGKILWRLSAHQGHLMPFAQEPGSITKQGKWSIRRPRVPGEAIAGQAIAAERHRWRAGGGHAERRPARLAGRASFALVRATGRRRFGRRTRTDHFSRYDDRRGVSHAGLKTSLGKRCRCATFQNIRFGESETDVLNGTVEIEDEGRPLSCPCLQPSPSNSFRARGHGSAQ
jgi:hypothetical protein